MTWLDMSNRNRAVKAAQWAAFNPEGGSRVVDKPGDATVLDGVKTDEKADFVDWKPWAYTAGGGALAYLLAKKLFDDDDDEDGKGKKSGFLSSIAPYLAAIGGGLGGYALSGMGEDGKGQAGEIAVKMKDGKIKVPEVPRGGGAEKAVGWTAAGAGTALGGRAAANAIYNRPANLIRKGMSLQLSSNPKEIEKGIELVNNGLQIHADRAARPDSLRRLGKFFGRNKKFVPGANGGLIGSVLSFLTAGGAAALANAQNKKREAAIAVRRAMGYDVDD